MLCLMTILRRRIKQTLYSKLHRYDWNSSSSYQQSRSCSPWLSLVKTLKSHFEGMAFETGDDLVSELNILSESAKLILEILRTVSGDCAHSYQTICRWVTEFNEGKESLSDCRRRRRPKSCVNEQTIASIKKDIDEDPHISVQELSDTNGLSYGTVHTIITGHLRMKKGMCPMHTPFVSG
ncbi:histone-lysine N-methyltransferase SETMAR [Elysia marginata]|uniref:Histone-lysine N-methyltransferase SETMAR n=1 Tax=Elysia marginata TaxID=1093978 RepID=A0AAV4G7C3_9GAST|nr:histone-lysine N-methyltransferase SETMAR [Elysia marginata]